MTHGLFFVSTNNPNDVTGGSGCVCAPDKQQDCKPPYIVIPGNEMDCLESPHPVVCGACVHRMAELLAGEVLSAGEDMTPLEPSGVTNPISSDGDSFTI